MFGMTEGNARSDRHRGKHLSLWLTDEAMERLDILCELSGRTRTKVVHALIFEEPLPERSYARTLAYLRKLGGLLKHSIDLGQSERVYRLGSELIQIAERIDANDHRQENQG